MKRGVILLSVVFFLGCDSTDTRLVVSNKSDKEISVQCETTPLFFNDIRFYVNHSIKPRNKSVQVAFGSFWEWTKKIRKSSTKKLDIYVFATDTLAKYQHQLQMQDITRKKMYDTIFSFTKLQLDSMNWEIVYDGGK